ncbi:helix-turn-helix domain-containing protein [Bogoriella caseilytica]|uniref:Helix-turn-helix protein n=1 Tax=Bogoriella caseilytica TaxID=56055 RepID=A0A3N2BG14_9MICO|nr:helix-turn-helix transcriptional regulator [Bogoriella caseilytica]ROR74203.1 helix-turn-helix protein [Bogoriella caseilytica]
MSILTFRRMTRRERLWREVLGEQLRERRRDQGRTLTDTARAAGLSPQYLSEIERGRKEPSSEVVAAVAEALGTTLLELTGQVTEQLRRDAAAATLTSLSSAPRHAAHRQRPASAPSLGSGEVQLSLAA